MLCQEALNRSGPFRVAGEAHEEDPCGLGCVCRSGKRHREHSFSFGHRNAGGNLVLMDGTINPAEVAIKIVRGNTAHILIDVPSDISYRLLNPSNVQVDQQTARGGVVRFQNVGLSATGTWTLKQGTTTQSTFEVVAFDGDISDIENDWVVTMTESQYNDISLQKAYVLEGRVYTDTVGTPHDCDTYGQNDAATPTTIPLNRLSRVEFRSDYRVIVEPDGLPTVGVTMSMFGEPPFVLGVGNFLVFSATMAIWPVSSTLVIYPQTLTAFVLFTSPSVQIDVEAWGECHYEDPLHIAQSDYAETDRLAVTIQSGS